MVWMMLPLLAASYLALAVMQATAPPAPAGPPAILQVHREPLKPGARAEYDRLESDTARQCAQLRCPHAYLALESRTGPQEIWWFNGYDSDADRRQVTDAWAASTELLAILGRNAKRKAALIGKAVESLARHRPDLGEGEPWQLGRGRFVVIWSGTGTPPLKGTVYETDDRTRFVIVPTSTADEADALAARSKARVFEVRPSWSHPDEAWIAADPELWRDADCRTFSSAGNDTIAIDGSFEGAYVVAFGAKDDRGADSLTVAAARESPDGGSDIRRSYSRRELPVELPRGTVRGFEFAVTGRRASPDFWITLARSAVGCRAAKAGQKNPGLAH
jgi:hypothetical protein